MNKGYFLFTIFSLIAINGCVTKYRPELDVKEAWVMSQGERVELTPPKEHQLVSMHEFDKELHLTAQIGQLYVIFGPLPGGRSLALYTGRERKTVTFSEVESFYQSDSNDKVPLMIITEEHLPTISPYWFVRFELPPELQNTTSMIRGSLTPEDAKRIKKNDDILHRFHFEFTVDGVPHVIDVSFELEVNTIWEPGVPATP